MTPTRPPGTVALSMWSTSPARPTAGALLFHSREKLKRRVLVPHAQIRADSHEVVNTSQVPARLADAPSYTFLPAEPAQVVNAMLLSLQAPGRRACQALRGAPPDAQPQPRPQQPPPQLQPQPQPCAPQPPPQLQPQPHAAATPQPPPELQPQPHASPALQPPLAKCVPSHLLALAPRIKLSSRL